tara:strand:+ start:428 stop:1081 length:654 start_codon:yes stop_codon:yes gene_type:complete
MQISSKIKICGIRQQMIAQAAQELGASHLGFILYEPSPRCISLRSALEIMDSLEQPRPSMVLVDVAPSSSKLSSCNHSAIDFFQIHFPLDTDPTQIREWSEIVGREKLWLAPQIPPSENFPETLLSLANGFLIDAYSEAEFGGTGKKSDWAEFIRLKTSFPEKDWILAGGLGPENLMKAVKQAQPDVLDCNSGVEDRPGEKNLLKMQQLFSVLNKAD